MSAFDRFDQINAKAEQRNKALVGKFAGISPMYSSIDGTIFGWKCECGAFWKIYQSPGHDPRCSHAGTGPAAQWLADA